MKNIKYENMTEDRLYLPFVRFEAIPMMLKPYDKKVFFKYYHYFDLCFSLFAVCCFFFFASLQIFLKLFAKKDKKDFLDRY